MHTHHHYKFARLLSLIVAIATGLFGLISLSIFLWPTQEAHATGILTVNISAGYNLVVDSNIEYLPTYAPSIATIMGEFCNTGTTALTGVQGHIGNFGAGTPGIYPQSQSGDLGFDTKYPHLAGTPGSYGFTHVGGAAGTADATRFIGTIPASQCRYQYWHFSYPRRGNLFTQGDNLGDAVWGATTSDIDDLEASFDIWGTSSEAINGNASWTMTHRNETSSNANKIQPNPDGVWFNTDTSQVQPGTVITSNGVRYALGKVNQGFDNDGDFDPDYNVWLQPVGDPAYDPSCFRLIRTTGALTVSRSSLSDLIIPFRDQLYFTDLPVNNTNVGGFVKYTFLALNGPCSTALTPYQEVASGSNNEKFNGDYGTSIPTINSSSPAFTMSNDSDPNIINVDSTLEYNISYGNTNATPNPPQTDLGISQSSGGPSLNFIDTIPAGLVYIASSITGPAGVLFQFSTDNGTTWVNTEPPPASVTTLRWILADTLAAGENGLLGFQVTVPGTYVGTPFIENTACASFGSADPFDCGVAITIVSSPFSSIGDTIWVDSNADGVQGLGEPGIPGVVITLTLQGGDILTTTTNSDGHYAFGGVSDGNHTVEVDTNTLPLGMVPTYDADGGTGTPDSSTSATVSGGHVTSTGNGWCAQAGPDPNCDMNIDFGFNPISTSFGTIGGYIWNDINQNGIQDASETGIPNITVTLYEDTNGNGIIDDAVIATTGTDVSGNYLFNNLPATAAGNSYLVQVDESDPQMPLDSGQPYVLSSNNNPEAVTLTSSSSDYLDADFGFTPPPPSVIGDFVWQDNDGDGIQDPSEPGIPGVILELQDDICTLSIDCPTAITDANGGYAFTGLISDSYQIYVMSGVPAGFTLTSDPDEPYTCAICDGSTSYPIDLPAGSINYSADFGYQPRGVIGDTIWVDSNGDGIQNLGEPGIPGVVIILTLQGGGILATTADNNGHYAFGGVPDGNHTVEVDTNTLPLGMAPTYDADGGTGSPNSSTSATVSGGHVTSTGNGWCAQVGPDPNCDMDLDFGYQLSGPYSISGAVFYDALNNGGDYTGGDGDSTIINITVYLYWDADGSGDYSLLQSTISVASGYSFTSLPDGNYVVSTETNSPMLLDSVLTTDGNNNDGTAFEFITGLATEALNVNDGGADDNIVEDVDFGFFGIPAPTAVTFSLIQTNVNAASLTALIALLALLSLVTGLALFNRRQGVAEYINRHYTD